MSFCSKISFEWIENVKLYCPLVVRLDCVTHRCSKAPVSSVLAACSDTRCSRQACCNFSSSISAAHPSASSGGRWWGRKHILWYNKQNIKTLCFFILYVKNYFDHFCTLLKQTLTLRVNVGSHIWKTLCKQCNIDTHFILILSHGWRLGLLVMLLATNINRLWDDSPGMTVQCWLLQLALQWPLHAMIPSIKISELCWKETMLHN